MCYQVHLAGHESEPSKNITDTCATVRGTQDSIDAVHDVIGIPAVVPGILNEEKLCTIIYKWFIYMQ